MYANVPSIYAISKYGGIYSLRLVLLYFICGVKTPVKAVKESFKLLPTFSEEFSSGLQWFALLF